LLSFKEVLRHGQYQKIRNDDGDLRWKNCNVKPYLIYQDISDDEEEKVEETKNKE